MKDVDKLKRLLHGFNVGYKYSEKDNTIILEDGEKNIDGYIGFYTIFKFDRHGKFVGVGAYE